MICPVKRLCAYIAAALIVLCMASTADAKPPVEGWGAASLRISQEYWGTTSPPLCTSTSIIWEQPPMWGPEHPAAATAPLSPEPCIMWVDPTRFSVYWLCVVMVHEYSHWMGYQWGYDPNTIQYDGDAAGDAWNPPFIHRCFKLAYGTYNPSPHTVIRPSRLNRSR